MLTATLVQEIDSIINNARINVFEKLNDINQWEHSHYYNEDRANIELKTKDRKYHIFLNDNIIHMYFGDELIFSEEKSFTYEGFWIWKRAIPVISDLEKKIRTLDKQMGNIVLAERLHTRIQALNELSKESNNAA